MHITSLFKESWDLMNRGTDPEGNEMCHVRHFTHDQKQRVTVFRLVKRPNGWYNVGQFIEGFSGFRPTPERKGKKLSTSRIDNTLRMFAEHGHGEVYA